LVSSFLATSDNSGAYSLIFLRDSNASKLPTFSFTRSFSAPCFAAHYRRYICLVDAAGINGRRHEFIGVLQSALPAVELYGFAVDNVVFIGEANSDSDFPEESPILLEKE
jgi:hypothetical protein